MNPTSGRWNWKDESYVFTPFHQLEEDADQEPAGDAPDDQCPDCRCAPNMPHSPDCAVGAPRYRQQNNDCCPVDCPTMMLNITEGEAESGLESIDVDDIVAIPLAVQERLFDLSFQNAQDELEELLGPYADWDAIRELCLLRLRSGYSSYGSEMFTWDAETRRRNVFEEIADAVVYLCSGPIE